VNNVTSKIVQFIRSSDKSSIPLDVMHAGKRAFINYLAVALYSSRDPSLKIFLKLFAENTDKKHASILGTRFKTNLENTALANGYLGHLADFDDTHFPTIIHPSSPTFPSALAIAENLHKTGLDFLIASILGIEICCRVGIAMYPYHYDQGWHITGTAGVFGSSISAGLLLDLDEVQFKNCLGVAGTQACGVRATFGTMTKPFHAGRASQSGLLAAKLALNGFTSTQVIFEGRRGFFDVLSSKYHIDLLTKDLGSHWEIFQNGLKPYACGVVNHPLIDAMIKFKKQNTFRAKDIKSIKAYVHPLVLELVGHKQHPATGLEAKFSFHHSMAVGLLLGRATPMEYTDGIVNNPDIKELRNIIEAEVGSEFKENAASVEIIFNDGTTQSITVNSATGSPDNPVTDDQLNDKFMLLVKDILGYRKTKELLDTLWEIEKINDMGMLVSMTAV